MVERSAFLNLSLVLALALLTAATLAACERNSPLRFPHEAHLAGPDCGREGKPPCLSCVSCHSPGAQGRAERLPERAVCTRCHEDQAQKTDRVLRFEPVRPYGQILFDHDRHLDMKEIEGQCVPCHGGVVEEGRPPFPPMASCLSCHEHQQQWQQAECTPCHLQKDLENTFPQTFWPTTKCFCVVTPLRQSPKRASATPVTLNLIASRAMI